jgi:hypothetical protein
MLIVHQGINYSVEIDHVSPDGKRLILVSRNKKEFYVLWGNNNKSEDLFGYLEDFGITELATYPKWRSEMSERREWSNQSTAVNKFREMIEASKKITFKK